MVFSFIRIEIFNIWNEFDKSEKGLSYIKKSYLNIRKLIYNNE